MHGIKKPLSVGKYSLIWVLDYLHCWVGWAFVFCVWKNFNIYFIITIVCLGFFKNIITIIIIEKKNNTQFFAWNK